MSDITTIHIKVSDKELIKNGLKHLDDALACFMETNQEISSNKLMSDMIHSVLIFGEGIIQSLSIIDVE
ncbi:MAG: hypothetical protein ACYC6W_10905 [Nitrosotalea sp.]